MLDFKPQKEIVYNRFLPYKDQLDEESNKFLSEIKYNLGRAVIFKETSPGVLYWSNRLTNYLKLYGRKFSKEDHLNFVHIFFELTCAPNLDPQYVIAFGHVLIQLLKKRELLSRDDLVLPWRPLYDLVEFTFYSKYEVVGLKKHPLKLEETVKHVVRVSRVYFSEESTQEMLDEWRPLMCPYDVTFGKAMFFFSLFLPTTLPPEKHDKSIKLWFDELLGIWQSCTNSARWEENCLKLFSRLARDNIGFVDWTPYLPTLFSRILHTFNLPVGSSTSFSSHKDYSSIISSYVVWTVNTMHHSSATQDHLNKLFRALESFYHPSNNGRYTGKLQRFLYNLPKEMIKRLHREKFPKKSWETPIPEEFKLTDDELTSFVECIKPAVMLAVFNKTGSFDAAGALQNLSLIKPDVVLPTLLDKLYVALATLTEPHQLTATLNCVTSVARALVRPDASYPAGRRHVLTLLQLVLPGIDPNDFRKSLGTFMFISTVVCLVPVVDCSEAVGVVEMTEDEKELCLATAQFEDFVLQFMDRCFVMIENSSFENTSELDSTTMKADQRHSLEGMMGMGVASTFHAILMQSSPKIFQSALEQLFAFCSNKVLETKVAGKMASDMCRAAARTNAPATLKMFVPHCCSVIEHLTSVEGMSQEEEVDDQLLWNLQILSEVVRSSGVLEYKEKLVAVIKATIHLKCKEAATLGATLLEHMLRPLAKIYPMEWRSVLVDFGTPPTEHLFIRDWGQPGDLDNLNIQWHIPNEEEKLLAKELLDTFLQPELTKVEKFVDESLTLSREELQQCLNIIAGCLLGAAILLPDWDRPPLENIGLKTLVSRGRFRNSAEMAPAVSMGEENSRARIAELIHKLLDRLLCHHEDDTKALLLIVKIYDLLMLHVGGQRDEFDSRWRSATSVKRAMEDRLAGKKKHVRPLLIERVQLQHEMRVLDRVSTQLTSLHKVLLDDLFKLATTVYTEVRIKAQRVLSSCIDVFDYFARTLIPPILSKLQDSPDVSHEEFKGALYVLLNNRMLFLVVHYWEVMVNVWPAIVKASHSEKPSITTLTSTLAEKMVKKYDTVAISRTITDEAVEQAKRLLSSSNPEPRTRLKQPFALTDSVLPDESQMQEAVEAWKATRETNLKNFQKLVETLVDMLESDSLRWRYLQICFNFVNLLIRYDVPLPANAVKLCVKFLNHDALVIRKVAIDAVGAILKQQKRAHPKIIVNPYSLAGLPEPSTRVIQPGDREDNRWLHYCSSNLPKSKEEWQSCVFIDKTHWGFYTWPTKLLTYAPVDQQPPLGRSRDELSEEEKPIYEAFSQEEFMSKFISFLSLEDRKGKDKFNVHRFVLFKGLFRNFDDSFLDLIKPHLEKLCTDSQESRQRCAVEIIAAAIRGCKHWNYEKVESLWDFLLPLLRKALSAVNVETLEDWGTCMATAVESRDPRRIYRFLELLIEDPLDDQRGSFYDSSRLYLIQGAFCQQEWRVPELLHRLVGEIETHLNHPYKNVRDRLGSVLCSALMLDLKLPNGTQTLSPKRKEFVGKVLPQLTGLQELAREKEMGSSDVTAVKTENVPDEEQNERSREDDERKEAIKRLKTMTNWLLSHAVRNLNSCPEEFFDLLPVIILFDSHEDDPELLHYCHRTITYLSQTELPSTMVPLALQTVKQIASNTLWHPRRTVLEYLQVMMFANLFAITSNPQHIEDVKELVLTLLEDEQLEVREMAAVTFSGLVHYGFLQLDDKLQKQFTKMANTELKKKRKGVIVGANGFNNDAALIHRHAGVLGLASCVQAFPYDVPSWMPQILLDLGEHLHDPHPIQATVKKVMSDFRRTHHDNWQEHKQKFTEDQLLVLTDLLVSPCYYA
ncbi:proteasome activator complex subunit 4-like [Acropora millepora]|uniref:proteasome activator complex subunit 4-like n=2 Tax=Acropora TaxID=6127 RepID=UPI001CF471A0|nr:proteasome activator complex subunit 4-like [Acropora millepora]